MQILLPPSETKRFGGGSIYVSDALAHHGALGKTRARVRSALIEVSRDEGAAAKALKLGVKNRDERLHNLSLDSSGALPAVERYTGVLYDALDVHSLDDSAREWISAHVSIQSALFGLLRSDDLIPAYRLSGSSSLPTLGVTLKRAWTAAHQDVAWNDLGWLLDLRSKDYVALAPIPRQSGSWLNVAQRGPSGEVRALNHFNKAAKGDLVRRLAHSAPTIRNAAEFCDWADSAGLEVTRDPETGDLTLVTTLGAPAVGTPGS